MEQRRLLRPLDLGSFFDETFYLFRNNFWLFSGIAGVVLIPLFVLASVIAGMEALNVAQYLSAFFQPIIVAAGTYAISKRYLGEPCTVGQAYKAVLKRLIPYLLTLFIANLMMVGGFIAFIIPGLIVFLWFFFVSQVFVLEGLEYGDARARSRDLAQGHWWRIFLVIAIFRLIITVITFVLTAPLAGVEIFNAQFTNPVIWGALGLYLGIVMAVFTMAEVIVMVLLYYDMRVRKEGFDLELLAQELNKQPIANQ